MNSSTDVKKLNAIMDEYLKRIRNAVGNDNLGKRERLFLDLVTVLTKSVQIHFELQKLESGERFKISKRKMKMIRDTHFKALGMFIKIPAPSKSSLYEMSVILAVADVVAAHAENPE